MRVMMALLSLLWVLPVRAHGEGAIPADVWTHWNFNALILIGLLVPTFIYLQGLKQRAALWRVACFLSGMLLLFIALISPVDALGGSLFAGHMIQHLLLVLGAAPLLALSQPMPALLRGLPLRWGKAIGDIVHRPSIQRLWQRLTGPIAMSLIHIAALWVWHLPILYSAAVQNETLHALEHVSFFGTALLYWWMICTARDSASRIISVFGVMMASGVLGALMTFAAVPWYSDHAAYVGFWGLTLLEDQQLAGLLMWIPSGIIYVIAAVALLGAWITMIEQHVADKERQLAKDVRDA